MGVLANGANACRANIKPTGQWAGQWPPGARGAEAHVSASPRRPPCPGCPGPIVQPIVQCRFHWPGVCLSHCSVISELALG